MAGYHKRSKMKAVIEQKRNELARIGTLRCMQHKSCKIFTSMHRNICCSIAEDMPSAAKVLLHQMNNNSPTAATISATSASYYSESDGDVNSGSIEARSDMLRVEAELIVDQVIGFISLHFNNSVYINLNFILPGLFHIC